MRSVAIVGCGYSGRRLAERWHALGARVRGYATRQASLRQIADSGAEALTLDLDVDTDREPIDCQDALVYYCVPPSVDAVDVVDVVDARLARFLAAVRGTPQRLLYLSTTGVYGDREGAVVTEETAPVPASARAMRRMAAETQVRAWADSAGATTGMHVSWCILRVSGIYGPGRLPLERLRRAEPAIVTAEASPGNRIHVSDLVSVCVAAGLAPAADCRIYNVTDGNEDSLTDYLFRVARIAGLPSPPLISRAEAQATFSNSSWSFLGESRRVDNRRMLAELDVRLDYRDLDKGIAASLED